PEYSPSWHIDVAPESDIDTIVAQYRRAVDAGAHMFAYTPWPHLVLTANGAALGRFLAAVKYEPRDARRVSYAPAPVRGLTASANGPSAAFRWSPEVFAEVPGFAWRDWPRFERFELWRGREPDFTTASGQVVGSTTDNQMTGIALRKTAGFYKVLAVSRDGLR